MKTRHFPVMRSFHAVTVLLAVSCLLFFAFNDGVDAKKSTTARRGLSDSDAATGASGEAFDLDVAERRAQNMVNRIYYRFDMWHPTRKLFFAYILNIPEWGWDILKYKLALKVLLEPGAKAKKRSEGGTGSNGDSSPSTASRSASSNLNKEFLFVFGGSSVTAGHDNWFDQSYPMVFERRVAGVFDALGVPLTVRNIAQGANNCLPYNYCQAAMGGDTPDFLNWEQSFNCGKAPHVYEMSMREASWSDSILFFSASGAFNPTECKPMPLDSNSTTAEAGVRTKMAWTHEQWTPAKAGLRVGQPIPHDYQNNDNYLAHDYYPYYPNASKVAEWKQMMHVGHMEANPVGRFTGIGWPHYNGVAPHGFSVWTSGSEGDAMQKKGPCYEEGGSHWMSHETGEYGRGHGAAWHPAAGMHMLRGELIAYTYLHVFIDAIHMLRADLGLSKDKKQLAETYKEKLKKLQTKMPEKPLHCGTDCAVQPQCYTNFEPHYNADFRLSDITVGGHEGWEYVKKPGSTSNMLDGVDWGYKDRRPCYESKGQPESTLSFKIEVKTQKFVKVCSYEHKEGLKHAHFYLHAYVDPPCSECEGGEAFDKKEGWRQGSAGAASGTKPTLDDNKTIAFTDEDAVLESLPTRKHSMRRNRNRRLGEKEVVKGNDLSKLASSPSRPNINTTAYVSPKLTELIPLVARAYHGDECHILSDLPVGKHVLTVATYTPEESAHKGHTYSVSHIISWNN